MQLDTYVVKNRDEVILISGHAELGQDISVCSLVHDLRIRDLSKARQYRLR